MLNIEKMKYMRNGNIYKNLMLNNKYNNNGNNVFPYYNNPYIGNNKNLNSYNKENALNNNLNLERQL